MEGGRGREPLRKVGAPTLSTPASVVPSVPFLAALFRGKHAPKNVASSSSVCNPRPGHGSAKPSYTSMYARERWTERRERIE